MADSLIQIDDLTPAGELGHPLLIAAIRHEIVASEGQITFARFMELALYHPAHGYYLAPERRPGRGGDFITAPEIHPCFGITLARQIAECWERLGQPDTFTIREYGAGVGGLAYDIIAGLSSFAPEVVASLTYQLIEPNEHRRREALTAMTEAGLGAIVTVEAIPAVDDLAPIVGVALANEVADALPVHRLVWRDGRFRERYVIWQDAGFGDEEGDLSPDATANDPDRMVHKHGITLNDGDAIEISPAAARWFAGVGMGVDRGYTLVIDYGYEARELYRSHRLAGTVRGYRGHTVTDDPYRNVGRQDLTAHVDFSALRRAGAGVGLEFAGFTNHGTFLSNLGLGDFLVALQADPVTSAEEYFATRAAIFRLIDPGGIGRFGVLAMARNAPTTPPLRGFAAGQSRY